MRLESFEYLVALSRHASMSAASRELHVTPQALSVAIGRLERELGVKLVRTDNQGTRLNENGRYLVAKTQMFFDAIAEVRAQSQAAEGPCAVRVLADKAIKEDFAAELVRRLDEAAQRLRSRLIIAIWQKWRRVFWREIMILRSAIVIRSVACR